MNKNALSTSRLSKVMLLHMYIHTYTTEDIKILSHRFAGG